MELRCDKCNLLIGYGVGEYVKSTTFLCSNCHIPNGEGPTKRGGDVMATQNCSLDTPADVKPEAQQ